MSGEALLDNIVLYIIDPLILLVFSTGFLLFVWGLIEFIWSVDDSSARETGKQHIIWGIIGMFIMVAMGGIISLIDNTFELHIFDQTSDIKQETNGDTNPPDFGSGRYKFN